MWSHCHAVGRAYSGVGFGAFFNVDVHMIEISPVPIDKSSTHMLIVKPEGDVAFALKNLRRVRLSPRH